MKRILVPIHPRSDLQNILRYAESVALRSQAELTFFVLGGILRKQNIGAMTAQIAQALEPQGIAFSIKSAPGFTLREILRETTQTAYDLMIVGGDAAPGIRRFLRSALTARLIGEVKVPVFVVPSKSRFNEIRHITYAVDLTDYNPDVIRQVKAIASLFDAKLTIAHVNSELREDQRERYLLSLERTISETMDYPKVYYKFFDHADAFGGIKNFVNLHNSQLLAMTNRKKFTWKDLFNPTSLTRKMAKELSIPVLAFRK
ncbi:MAG: universal stress protein [Bacteroidetes bacterium]|nr:MAG: universal stress protein [Bacteroidota bacterium]